MKHGQGSHCPLSLQSPGAAKLNEESGTWSSFLSFEDPEIHVSFASGNALVVRENPRGKGKALKEKPGFLLN